VKRGRRVARVNPVGGLLFRSPDLWKGLLAVGGAASARPYGMPTEASTFSVGGSLAAESKGEPPQIAYHSATAPPGLFKQLTLIDLSRKP
jgi:hypothetical protein